MLPRLQEIVDEGGRGVPSSMPELAIGWLLAQPGVSCVLTGASKPSQAVSNAASGKELPAAVVQAATQASWALKDVLDQQGGSVDQYASESRIH